MLITPQQIRAGRALLKWGQDELSRRAGVSVPAIANIENERQQASVGTQQKIVLAFSAAGVEMIDGGVRQVRNLIRVFQGEDANKRLLDDVYASLKESGGEVLISGLREPEPGSRSYRIVSDHIERLRAVGVSERILLEEGDMGFVGPTSWYRWVPSAHFSPHTFQLYANKIAMIHWGPPQEIILIESSSFAESFRSFFNFTWENARIPDRA